MQHPLPIDTDSLNSAHSARLLAYYEAFCSPDEERHLWLAAHAAFPVVLTSDLLYKLWLNFRLDEQGDPLNIPMIAVSDLLLSTLCRPTSRQVYEMPQDIRTALLFYLKDHSRFGVTRVQRLAHFLKFYLRENPRQLPSRAFAKAQEFTWLAQLDPQAAAEQLLEAWNRQKDKESLRQMLAWSEQQAQLLSGEEGQARNNPLSVAIQILRGFQHFQEGKQAEALQELEALKGRARKEQPEGGEGIRMDVPQAVLDRLPGELFGEKENNGDEEKQVKRYAKIHLLFHHSLDKRKLLKQLFPEKDFSEDKPLHCFAWQSNLDELGLIGEISYNIWAWDSSLPPELDRFVLTPGGQYFVVVSGQAEIAPLLHRIYSQVGQEEAKLLAASSGEDPEPQLGAVMEGMSEPVFVKMQMDFNSVLLEIVEKQAERVPYIELPDKSLPTQNKEILTKGNQAGLLRYEPDRIPYYPGFQSASPSTDFGRMDNILESARQNEGWLSGEALEATQRHPIALDLLQKMGLIFETVNGLAYLPAHLSALKQSFSDVAYTCLRYSFEFLPHDFELRLYQRLIRAGTAFFNVKRPHIHGIPIGICTRTQSGKQVIEVHIAHDVVDEPLKGSLVFFTVLREEISGLLNAEEKELFHLDKIEFFFALLLAWPEAPFFSQMATCFEEWGKAAKSFINGPAGEEEYLPACQNVLKRAQGLLDPLPSGQAQLPPARLAEKVAGTLEKIVADEGSSSYPYQLSRELQTLHIPAHATPDMISIQGGTFQMGDVMADNEYDDEKPIHEVTLGNFSLGRYPVTFQEYDAFCEAVGRGKPEDQGWGRANRPAINVDWYDAIEYCNWLSELWGLEPAYQIEKDKKDPNNQSSNDDQKWLVTPNWQANGYRLPTEAEWEYAARAVVSPSGKGQGGGKVRFGNGKDIADPKEINFDASKDYKKPYSLAGEYREKTTPVGSFQPNALGLHDMSGNVYDWCWDWFDGNYYQKFESQPAKNPAGPEKGSYRVLRGGSWSYYPQDVRAAYRGNDTPVYRYDGVGFRLARTF